MITQEKVAASAILPTSVRQQQVRDTWNQRQRARRRRNAIRMQRALEKILFTG